MKYPYVENIPLQRERLLNSEAAKPFLEELIQLADEAVGHTETAFKMSEYMLFYKNGNRKVFEKKYFYRRRKCFQVAVAYWLTEDDKYLEPLVDLISYICDEFTWCVPAHSLFGQQSVQDMVEHIDLFQAETARLFAELIMCLGAKLPAYIQERMKLEVQRRVITPLCKGRVFNWHISDNNWASVCAGSSALAVLYFATDEQKEKILPPIFAAADHYLSGIGDNGSCVEGMSYWTYGFSHFIILANIIKWCGGKDYYGEQKVKDLALFPQRVRLSDSKCAAIADSSENFVFRIGPMCFLKSVYPEVRLPDLRYGVLTGNVDSFCDLLWFDPDYQKDPPERETCYLADVQWYMNRKNRYSFVACGGNNGESHSHNDIGSFMITVGDQVFLSDLGCGEYVKETFLYETRYTFVQNSSRGHSVPIVNGTYQKDGKAYAAKNVLAAENSFSMDMEGAYEAGLCEKLHRCFVLDETSVTLTDTVQGASIIERFISKIPPTVCDGYVDYGIGRIVFDPNLLDVTVGQETFVAHDGYTIVTVYQTDFTSKEPDCTRFRFRIVV